MTSFRTLLVANPRATRVTPAARELIAHALASVTKLDVVETTHAGNARELAAAASGSGIDLVVALGGDGTVNEVANGLLDAGGTAALGVVPSGGADVFARTIGLPNDTVEAADVLVRTLESGVDPVLRGVGTLDGRAFLFNAGIGYDAAVVAAVDRHPHRKRRYGDPYFVMQALKVFAWGYPRRSAMVVVRGTRADGTRVEAAGALAIMSVSDPFTYLGSRPFRLCPEADPDRGVCIFLAERMTTVKTLRVVARGFRDGRQEKIAGMSILKGLVSAEISAEPELLSQADGETGATSKSFSVGFRPDALRVLLPATS